MSVKRLINKALNLENNMSLVCQQIAAEAQKKAPFLKDVSCAYYQSDGLCLEIPQLLDQENVTISAISFFYHKGKYKSPKEIYYL